MTLNIRREKALSFFESVVTTIISPFQSLATSSSSTVKSVWDQYFYLVDLKQQNTLLLKELQKLKQENSRYVEQDLQYKRLINLLDFKKTLKQETLVAEVIGLDPSTWSRIVFINRGENSAVSGKMAVVNHDGLVGQVVNTTAHSAKILLITDVRSAVDVLIQNNRSRGMVVGLNKDFCLIKYVPIAVEVNIGDRVVSSGLGGVFPKGLLVGFVKSVKKEKYDLFQHIELTPSADLSRLEEVIVIK